MFVPYIGNHESLPVSGQWIRINDHNVELGDWAGKLVSAEDILTLVHETCIEIDATWSLAVISTATTTPLDDNFPFVVYDGMTFKAEPSHERD